MKNLIIITLVLLSFQSIGQTHLELTYSNEDKALGFNAMQFKNNIGLLVGFEKGAYTDVQAKTAHQKYRGGLATQITFNDPYGNDANFIIYGAACYNEYQIKYDKFDHIKDNLPDLTAEVGIKFVFSNLITSGFQYDIIHRTGGFSLGICLNKKQCKI